jgi:hypothetical protein
MITLNCINLHASSAMPPTKLSLLRAAATKGDWTCALSIAAKFPQLGAHKAAITRAHGAIQNPTDPRYQDFLGRAAPAEVLGTQRRVASLADLFQGKLWAAADPECRPTKGVKDELDLLRIAEGFPQYVEKLPEALRTKL